MMGKTETHQDAVLATGVVIATRDDVVAIGLAEHHKCGFLGRLRIRIVL